MRTWPRWLSAFSFRRLIQLFATVTFYVLSSMTARAEPISLSGSITLINGGVAGVRSETSNLTGLNFSASVIAVQGNFGLVACSTSLAGINGPCTGASLSWVTSGGDFSGTFVLNGIAYPANIINQLGFNFSSVTFVVPIDLLNSPGVEVIAPFTFTGLASTPDQGATTFLVGEGTVRLLLVHGTVGAFTGLFLDHATYTFGTPVPGVTIQAIPEPVTLLLFATGIAGLVIRLRRDRR